MYLKTDTSLINLSRIKTISTEVKNFSSYGEGLSFNLFIVYLDADCRYYIPSTVTCCKEEAEELAKEVIDELMEEMMTGKDLIKLKRFRPKFLYNDKEVWEVMKEYAQANSQKKD